jgi:hypothetical protein
MIVVHEVPAEENSNRRPSPQASQPANKTSLPDRDLLQNAAMPAAKGGGFGFKITAAGALDRRNA